MKIKTKSKSVFYSDGSHNRNLPDDQAVCWEGQVKLLGDIPDGAKFSFSMSDQERYTKIGKGKTFTVLCVITDCPDAATAKAIVSKGDRYGGVDYTVAAVKEYDESKT